MIDAAKAFQASKGPLFGGIGRPVPEFIVPVRNDTGLSLPRAAVLGLGGMVFTPQDSPQTFEQWFTFKGITPDPAKPFVIALDSRPDMGSNPNWIIRGALGGIVPVQVNMVDPSHHCARPSSGISNLTSSRHGPARILWKESDSYAITGLQWALVALGLRGESIAVGKAVGTITARVGSTYGTGTVALYRGSGSSGTAETACNEAVAVLNAAADGAAPGSIADGKYCSVGWDDDNRAWVAPIEC
jgi:hypothetical protein